MFRAEIWLSDQDSSTAVSDHLIKDFWWGSGWAPYVSKVGSSYLRSPLSFKLRFYLESFIVRRWVFFRIIRVIKQCHLLLRIKRMKREHNITEWVNVSKDLKYKTAWSPCNYVLRILMVVKNVFKIFCKCNIFGLETTYDNKHLP